MGLLEPPHSLPPESGPQAICSLGHTLDTGNCPDAQQAGRLEHSVPPGALGVSLQADPSFQCESSELHCAHLS